MGVNHSLEIKNGNKDVGNEIGAGYQRMVFDLVLTTVRWVAKKCEVQIMLLW